MESTDLHKIHEFFAVDLFNKCWDVLLMQNRQPADEQLLLDMAHASLYHWRQIGQPINILRGQWMLAHAYTMLGHREEALYHAKTTLDLAIKQNVGDWDLAYAYSAMARVYALLGNKPLFDEWYAKSIKAGDAILSIEDKDQFFADLYDDHWFGIKET